MTDAEVDAFLQGRRTMNVASIGADGRPHLVAMWYGFVDGAIAFETFAKSQKVSNLRRDDRMTVLVEAGDSYDQLRGVELVGRAEVIEDHDVLMAVARSVIGRYQADVSAADIDAVAEMMVRKRVAVRFTPERTVSWDHRKLAGGY